MSRNHVLTPDRIFLTAEALFAERGFHGVTLRQITQAADVNLAAVNYHYSDKESLYVDVVTRRLRQVNTLRAKLFDDFHSSDQTGLIPIDTLLDFFARPLFTPGDCQPSYTSASRRLLGRVLTEPLVLTTKLVAAEFRPGLTHFGQQLRRHFPTVPPADFLWKLSFVVGALHHALATLGSMKAMTSGICGDDDAAAALRHYVIFARSALQGAWHASK